MRRPRNKKKKNDQRKKYVGIFKILDIKYLQHLFYAAMLLRVCISQDLFIVFYELIVDYVIQVKHKRIMKRTRHD